MNSFGKIFKVQIFGESHGPQVGVCIDGCIPGLEIKEEYFLADLKRRQGGNQKATTPRKEADLPNIISGVFNEHTTGTPITILFENANTRSEDYEKKKEVPRPGHADFVATKKFNGFEDYRGGGHFSGRLTVALVAAGVIAKKYIESIEKNISIKASINSIAGNPNVEEAIQKAIDAKDSVGGIVSCEVEGIPIGLGEPFFYSVESALSAAVFAIPAIKGIEFGAGFAAAEMFGSEHNDALQNEDGKTKTNNAGGIVGGISNGNNLVFNVVVKPTSSTPKIQQTLNTATNEIEDFSVKGRHDLCIALRVPVVLEAVTAIVLADLFMLHKAHQ